jgi:large subunit ribosomal protein L30
MAAKQEVKPVARTTPGKSSAAKTIKVTLIRSPINTRASHRATVRGLGLRRLRHTVELEDTPAVRGMINKVGYLLSFED